MCAVLAGAVLYLVGAILVTVIFNVPRNDALARVNPSSASASLWSEYLLLLGHCAYQIRWTA